MIDTINTMTLTKEELADVIYNKIENFTKREALHMVELFFTEISNTLADGKNVHLSGFGNFTLRNKRARPGRNPRTGEDVAITSRRVVTFHQGQKLKQIVEKYNERK